MLKTVRRAFQIEDIRRRILYTFAMLIVVRLGSELPTPGVDPTFIQEFFQQHTISLRRSPAALLRIFPYLP